MNILVTNFNGGGEDVLIMTEEALSPLSVGLALAHKKQTFDEVYSIKDEERQFYCFDPLWPSKETVDNIKQLAEAFTAANKGSRLYESITSKCGR